VGGSVSLLETSAAASGFLRRVKKPTAMGMAIKMKEKQSIAIPAPAGIVPELLTPFNSVVYGIIPAAVTAPKMHKHKPGHPHNTTAAMVATIPFVFVSIFFSPLVN
jgi:ABC-type phosphate transport system permease subunit